LVAAQHSQHFLIQFSADPLLDGMACVSTIADVVLSGMDGELIRWTQPLRRG